MNLFEQIQHQQLIEIGEKTINNIIRILGRTLSKVEDDLSKKSYTSRKKISKMYKCKNKLYLSTIYSNNFIFFYLKLINY